MFLKQTVLMFPMNAGGRKSTRLVFGSYSLPYCSRSVEVSRESLPTDSSAPIFYYLFFYQCYLVSFSNACIFMFVLKVSL